MGKGRCGQRLSGRCAPVPGGRGRSSGRGHGHGRDHGDGHDRGCSLGHGHEVAGSSGSLRNQIGGDYHAIARQVHVVRDE